MRRQLHRYLVAAGCVAFCCAIAASQTLPLNQAVTSPASSFTVDDLLNVANVNIADFSNDGRFVVLTEGSLLDRVGIDNHRFGDPTYIGPAKVRVRVIDTASGKSQDVFPVKQQVRAVKLSPDTTRVAMVVIKGESHEALMWDRTTGKTQTLKLPKGHYPAENTDFEWSPDSKRVVFSLRNEEWRKKARDKFDLQTKGPVVVLSSKEPFLAWEDLRRMSSRRSLVSYNVSTGQIQELVPETRLTSYSITEDGSYITYFEDTTPKTDYDTIFGTENQVQIMPVLGGPARIVIKSTKGFTPIWSRDGQCYAYAKDGNIFFGTIDDKEPRQLTGKQDKKTEAEKPEETASKPPGDESANRDKEKKERERYNAVRLSPKGDNLVVSNKEGLWVLNTQNGAKEIFIKMAEDDKLAPRYNVVDWDSTGEAVYLSYSSRTKWERGLFRYRIATKQTEELVKDSRLYSGYRVSRDGGTIVFSAAEGNRPGDIFVADRNMKNVRRLTEANPQLKAKTLGKTELVSYLDVDGNKLFGVLYYPADYEPGKRYPTVFDIYEQFFDDTFNGTINVLTANGYAVMRPSVTLETGYPGEAWLKGVTAAANKLIEMGVADPERLGVQGTSYGGYATNLLVTQTNRFKAAINISGKVNMVSFYTDSPRLGVRNIHAPEKSQDRIGATLWQQPQKYVQHSAIMFADRIKTPLLLVTGEQDHNVPARQAMEMFYALRRLGKEVEWVTYVNGGHGIPTSTVEEVRDYHQRILDWYKRHLKSDQKKKSEE